MPILTGTVGQGGNNRVHDVAVIQAALTNANLPGAGRGFWQGRIDGRKSPALDEAICAFQQAARAQVTGRIAQSGADTNKLEGALPHTHKNMRAVASTAAVWRTNGRAKRFAEVAKAAEGAPFPKAERTALAAIAKRSAQSFGLGVELEDAAVTADGRFRARLGVPDIEWLDAGGTRFQKNGPVPAEVARNLARVAQGNPTWRAVAQPGDGALIELTSMRVYKPLHGAPTPSNDDYNKFGISQRPNDQISRACIAGCAKLAAEGGLDAGDKGDFEAMLSVLEQTASAIANAIRGLFQLSQAQAQSQQPSLQFDPGLNPATVSPYSEQVLKDAMNAVGLTSIRITSLVRTLDDQARVMYDYIGTWGEAAARGLYNATAEQVIDVYVAMKPSGATRKMIIAAMSAKIQQIKTVDPIAFKHTVDPVLLNTIDIAPSSVPLTLQAGFEAALRQDSRISKVLVPPKDKAFHVEIPQSATP